MDDSENKGTDETAVTEVIVDEQVTVFVSPRELESAATPDITNTIIRDRFVIEQRLGKGGMGQVFKARDLRREEAEDDEPFVAIKFLGEEFSKHPRALISLQREAKKSQQLAHPNILTVYDFDRDGDRVYMTMELLDGAPLSAWTTVKYVDGSKPTIPSLVTDIASGLIYAHKFGVIHSDLKPDNVMVSTNGRAKILDFGIARIVDSAVSTDSYDAGELGALTLRYASLEMLQGTNDPHPADDVYALGIMAYQLFTEEHPYKEKTAEEACRDGMTPQPIRGIKRYQWKAISNALQLERKNRTASAEQFLQQFSGKKNRNRNVLLAIAVLALSSTFLAYQVSLSEGPAVPFDSLTPAVQQQFKRNMDLGQQSADIQDWDGASRYFIAAYDLHPRNPDAEKGLESLVKKLLQLGETMDSLPQKEYLVQMIDAFSGNEFLANNKELSRLRDKLAKELGLTKQQ